jgi:hypothetical protein
MKNEFGWALNEENLKETVVPDVGLEPTTY